MDLVKGRHHPVTRKPAATDKHDLAKIAVLFVELARLIPHRHSAVWTNRRPESRLLLKGLAHGHPPNNPFGQLTLETESETVHFHTQAPLFPPIWLAGVLLVLGQCLIQVCNVLRSGIAPVLVVTDLPIIPKELCLPLEDVKPVVAEVSRSLVFRGFYLVVHWPTYRHHVSLAFQYSANPRLGRLASLVRLTPRKPPPPKPSNTLH
jgi:hypothetical protein